MMKNDGLRGDLCFSAVSSADVLGICQLVSCQFHHHKSCDSSGTGLSSPGTYNGLKRNWKPSLCKILANYT